MLTMRMCGLVAAITIGLCFGFTVEPNAQVGPAVVAARGPWVATKDYVTDDLVTSRGSTWRAKRASKGKVPGSTAPSTALDWEQFAAGLNPLGPWRTTTTYHSNDVVTHLGSSWRARRTSLNKTPNTSALDWQQFAAQGATGPAGPSTLGNGTQTTPAIRFTSSGDTGIFSPGGGKIAMVQNGSLFLHNLGADSIALGLNSLGANTTGIENAAVGSSALFSNTTGKSNTAVGYAALFSNTSGQSNTAVGRLALSDNVAGSRNTAVGDSALLANTENDVTAVGYRALTANTGFANTALGSDALRINTSGFANSAVGLEALTGNTDGTYNVAVGSFSLQLNATGGSNVGVGSGALRNNSAGNGNVAIGKDAGYNPTNPSNSIFIGNNGQAGDTLTIKIGIQGTQTSAFVGGIRGVTTGVNDAIPVLIASNGQLGTVSSSQRYKFDIASMNDMGATLGKLRPVTFRYRKPQTDGSHPLQYGLIAEEVAAVMPDLAVFNADGTPETVKYHLLPSLLLAGYQQQQHAIVAQVERDAQQQRVIDAQASEIRAQRAEITALEQRLRGIEAMLVRRSAALQ